MTVYEKFVAFYTILIREVRRFMRIWPQTLVPPAITIALYFVIFGSLIGSRIGEMGGFTYMEFVVPGLIMMAVITNAYSNVVSSFYGIKFQRSIEELLVSPTPNYIILLGFSLGGVTRGLTVGLIVTILALFFTDLQIHNVFITAVVVFFTAVLFSLAGLLNAIFADSFDDISIIPNFVLTPLIYLGGVFYSIDLLPEFWANLSLANPILYMVNAFRYGLLGVSDINVFTALLIIFLFSMVAFGFCLYLLKNSSRLRQ
jgi:ABC-2 type transport system permease protein